MSVAGDNVMELSRGAADVYQPRNPRASDYFRCIEAHFEQLEMLWDDRYANQYGFWRPYVKEVIYRYPWPRPGLICQLQETIFLAMNLRGEFKKMFVAPGRAGLRGSAFRLCKGQM